MSPEETEARARLSILCGVMGSMIGLVLATVSHASPKAMREAANMFRLMAADMEIAADQIDPAGSEANIASAIEEVIERSKKA